MSQFSQTMEAIVRIGKEALVQRAEGEREEEEPQNKKEEETNAYCPLDAENSASEKDRKSRKEKCGFKKTKKPKGGNEWQPH